MPTQTRQSGLRATSVYSLRVAYDANPNDLLDSLVDALGPVVVTDTHYAKQDGTPYVSVSFRIPTSDTEAVRVAGVLIAAVGAREAYLHTGLGVHRRVIDLPVRA